MPEAVAREVIAVAMAAKRLRHAPRRRKRAAVAGELSVASEIAICEPMMPKPPGTARKMRACSEVLPSASEAVKASMAKIPCTEMAEVSSAEMAEMATSKVATSEMTSTEMTSTEVPSTEVSSTEVSSTEVTGSRFGGNGKRERTQR